MSLPNRRPPGSRTGARSPGRRRVERVGVAAFGQQADAAAAEQQEAVQQPVGEFDWVDVMLHLGGGDVADD